MGSSDAHGGTQACGATPSGSLLRTATYDAETRMVSVTDSNGHTSTYVYDGDGRRVQKTTPSGTTTFIYDPMGNLAQEYGPSSASGTEYLSVDALGSTRLVVNPSGTPIRCYDYVPFGQEIGAGTAGRPSSSCYTIATYPLSTADVLTDKFTGKERDAESGLDYFGARYMSSAQGRFTSPDPKQFNSKFLSNPQKWNKYAYTLNNPLALVDPDGKEEVTVTYRAFIPQSQVSIGGFTFRGDNRTFSTAGTASSRIAISVRVETDPSIRSNPLIGTPQVSVGQTERISPFHAVDTAKSGLPTANVSRDENGNVVIQIDANAKNPLVPFPASLFEPGIKPNLIVTIPTDASTATVTGQTSAFPAQEVNGTVGTATNPLFQFSPTSTNPLDLYKTVQVNQTKPLPHCTTDADGKRTCQRGIAE